MEELEKIKKMVESGKISQGQISRETGLNRAIISLVLAKKYTGDVKSKENRLIRWYREREQRNNLEQTSAFEAILTVLKMAHEKQSFALVMANSGCGKTETAKYYAQSTEGVAYYEANETDNAHSLLFNIGKACGVNMMLLRGSLAEKMAVIVDHLNGHPQLIIIDQADELNFKPIDIIRTIWDSHTCGLVLLGMPILEEILTRGRSRRENYDYIYSRISLRRRIGRPSLDDIYLILRRYRLEVSPKTAKYLLDFIAGRGEMRMLTNICENAASVAFQQLEDEEKIQYAMKIITGITGR